MMVLITSRRCGEFVDELAEMHRLRYRIFRERLGWDVRTSGGVEVDEFDALHPTYLLQKGDDEQVHGCVRLLPSTGPTMLREIFPVLLCGQAAPASPTIWESSRFALDLGGSAATVIGGVARATYELRWHD